jgi:hypothetical protein
MTGGMMRRMRMRAAWLIVAAASAAAPAHGQQKAAGLPQSKAPKPAPSARANLGVIDGWVSDTNLVPLTAAVVSVLQVHVRIGTSPVGRFRISDVPAGHYLLLVRRAGYRPTSEVVDVPAGDTVRVSYTLERATQTLGTVVIEEKKQSVRMREFEQRRRAGVGVFITAADLDARGSASTSDALMQVPAMSVTPDQSNSGALIAMSRREGGGITSRGEPAYCPMLVMLDGVKLSLMFDLRLLPTPKDIAGIEIYSGPATIPLQFGLSGSQCGVMMVWTKEGY